MNICESLSSIRPIGKVTCATFHGAQFHPRKARIKNLGFSNIPDELWLPISVEDAKDLALKSICFHIEDNEKILDESLVIPMIDGLFNGFTDSNCFTNFDGSYECISNSFLDIAIMIENDKGVTGFICVEDNQQS